MRLIDADELIDHKFKSASERMDLSVAYMKGWNDAIDSIDENAPTIEAEPIRHGHWTRIGHIETWVVYKCSMCENQTIDNGNYCPNCGAKMDLNEVNDEVKDT